MGLSTRDGILAGLASIIAWTYAVERLPTLRWLAYAFIAGLLIPVAALLAVLLLTSRGSGYGQRHATRRPKGPAFLASKEWAAEVVALRSRQRHKKQPLYAESFIVSDALDELLELIIRDFVNSWYSNISKNPAFPNEVDKVVRIALANLRDRVLALDIVEVVTTRFVPLLTAHIKDFYDAERAIRGKHLNRNVTESEELDLAIARRYKDGKLHPAASLSYSDLKLVQQEYLRNTVKGLLPRLLPESAIGSRSVAVLFKELVACAVLFPVMQTMSDPDTWNQIMEGYGRTMLQDRSTVRKLRAALDEHASPAPKSKRNVSFPRIAPHDNERRFEKFIRGIRKVNNLSDARRFRSEVSSQLKKDASEETHDPIYLRRLEIGKRILDQRVNQLAAGGQHYGPPVHMGTSMDLGSSRLENARLVDLLRDTSGLSYFMEYMDRQHLMPLVQFWIVVDGFRNPLEDDVAEDAPPANLPPWSESDRTDLAQIFEAYLMKPELKVPEQSKQAVREFLKAGKHATPLQYYKARRATLQAQTAILEEMQALHYPNFKRSDLWYKCLTSQETSNSAAILGSSNTFPVSAKPMVPVRTTSQVPAVRTGPVSRVPSKLAGRMRPDLRRSAASSSDISSHIRVGSDSTHSRRSFDDEGSNPLFDEDIDNEPLNGSIYSVDQDGEAHDDLTPDKGVVEAMEAALNNIMEDRPNVDGLRGSLFGENGSPNPMFGKHENDSNRSSFDIPRSGSGAKEVERSSAVSLEKPSIASLGLVNPSSRIGVFNDNDLFGDEEKFLSDEHDDPEDDIHKDIEEEVHEAAPGDLGLAEAITALTVDIDRMLAQDAVIDSLTRKAELTNNTAELRILRKSKASLQREIRRKELQRQQYVVQESDSSLYRRSTVKIKSIMVGRENDGTEYAIYIIEVQRQAGEQMPAATWTITRRYSEFHNLHQRLRDKYRSVRGLDFPRRRMVMKLQRDFLHKRRVALEKYLHELLLLPDVCRSRELRAFLSQSVIAPNEEGNLEGDKQDMMTRFYNSVTDGMEDLMGNIPILDQLSVTGQNLLSAATNQLSTMPSTIIEDPLTAAEAEAELNAFEDRELEPFVKPICDIFLEVFELNRGNNWLRGRAVVVVLHQLLGGTIERKVRDNVKALLQEESVVRYVGLIKDIMWPGGQLNRDRKVRTASEKANSRTEASLMLATLIPDLAGSVVGRVNAQSASRRIFATFNNPRLNAHLTFTFLDEIIDVLFNTVPRA